MNIYACISIYTWIHVPVSIQSVGFCTYMNGTSMDEWSNEEMKVKWLKKVNDAIDELRMSLKGLHIANGACHFLQLRQIYTIGIANAGLKGSGLIYNFIK